jgi:hypothetical protein
MESGAPKKAPADAAQLLARGICVGAAAVLLLGRREGKLVGCTEGLTDGSVLGLIVGLDVGLDDGLDADGEELRERVGNPEGST